MRNKYLTRLGFGLVLAATIGASASAQQFLCQPVRDSEPEQTFIPPQFLLQYAGDTVTVTHPWFGGERISRQVPVRGSGGVNRINYTPGDLDLRNGDTISLYYQIIHRTGTNTFEVAIRSWDAYGRVRSVGSCAPL